MIGNQTDKELEITVMSEKKPKLYELKGQLLRAQMSGRPGQELAPNKIRNV